jgi:hypothetical protein
MNHVDTIAHVFNLNGERLLWIRKERKHIFRFSNNACTPSVVAVEEVCRRLNIACQLAFLKIFILLKNLYSVI